jgi:hypothetical protein
MLERALGTVQAYHRLQTHSSRLPSGCLVVKAQLVESSTGYCTLCLAARVKLAPCVGEHVLLSSSLFRLWALLLLMLIRLMVLRALLAETL